VLVFSSFKLSLESYAADMKEIKREKKETQATILLPSTIRK